MNVCHVYFNIDQSLLSLSFLFNMGCKYVGPIASVDAPSTLSKVLSTLSTVDKVEFDFVASAYWVKYRQQLVTYTKL